ncbi:unnamed protein product [Triticum turgidum subsp. durum]|uniref:Uncharacterized protein n=1 Tax=Triticum turgidum subsp. durum TaxID=4567 RepID=A0A9R1AJ89_TRITD|nr:unnamed protein product [Triticum turgidum subsp. durum]
MGGRNRRWPTKRHHDASSNPRPPPPYSGYSHVDNQCQVPLWEREFCSLVGGISWQRFCENKHFAYMYKEIEQWDDSGAFENFQNAKSRFWSHYHGQPSDIPYPNPDLYIDEVDHRCEVDPELVADLDKVRVPFEADNEPAVAANNRCAQNQSGNWDIYLEKPTPEVNKWEADNSASNAGWGASQEPLSSWNKISTGWGEALAEPGWGSSGNNHCPGNNWSSSHGVSSNNNTYYQDPGGTYGRKRNSGGGYSQQRNSKQRNQAESHHQRGRWQDHRDRGRHGERFLFDNRPNGQRAERGF